MRRWLVVAGGAIVSGLIGYQLITKSKEVKDLKEKVVVQMTVMEDLEQKSLNNITALNLRKINEVKRLNELKVVLKEKGNVVDRRIEEVVMEMKRKNECKICFEKTVDRVMQPCSHTICRLCSVRNERKICPFCRMPIQGLLPIKFS